MLRSKVAVILMGLLLAACAEDSQKFSQAAFGASNAGIVGGEEVVAGDIKASSLVMIYGEKETGEAYICTGTFISANIVLTAAHCVVDSIPAMTVMFGAQPFVRAPEMLVIKSVKKHQDYNPGAKEDRNDIALIFLEGAMPQDARIAPLVSASSQSSATLESYGYGRTEGREDSENFSDELGILRKVSLDGRSLMSFDASLYELDQTAGKGVCFGDSGGPLFSANGELVAIAAGVEGDGISNDACSSRAFFTNVLAFEDWISANIISP